MLKTNSDSTSFGIPKSSFQLIITTLHSFPEIKWVKLYGSRALGTEKKGSDIDIAYSGPSHIQAHLLEQLEDLSTPYTFDVTHYEEITEIGFKHHIDNHGVLLIKKIGI